MPESFWTVDAKELVEARILRSAEEIFTDIHIVFRDRATGEESVAHAYASEARERFGLLERVVRAKKPMDAHEAQDLADRAAAVGRAGRHGSLTLRLDQPVTRGDSSRPAREIEHGDRVHLAHHAEPLHVFGLIRDEPVGTVLLMVGEADQGERLEVELALLLLERQT